MKKLIQYIVLVAIVTVQGCTGKTALFDELADSRLTVIIKGTFESTTQSSSIKDWDTSVTPTQSIDDSVNDFITDSSEQFSATFMVDIAEIRLAKPDGSSEDKVANYRQVFTASVDDNDPFFNGQGVCLKCDDIKPGKLYGIVKLYIRKLIFDNATQWHFDSNGNIIPDDVPQVIFHEDEVNGFDFNQILVNTYYDYLKENYQDINRVFPLEIPIDGGLVVEKGEDVILEIRLVIKNFIKLYEYDFINDSGYAACYHFWAVSDWLRDVKPDDIYMGGNLLGVARAYRANNVTTVSGNAVEGFVIAIPSTDVNGNPQTIADYFLDDDNTEWTRPNYQPAQPSLKYGTVEGYLDYYLRYEQYKIEYNAFVDDVGSGDYETNWNSYDGYKWSLRLPPLVAYSGGSGYTLTNVPHGEYLFYRIPISSVSYGNLPPDPNDFIQYSGNPVTINADTTVDF